MELVRLCKYTIWESWHGRMAASAAEAPVSVCAGCHMAKVAKTDMTWVQFYPCSATNENVNAQKGGRREEGGVATSFLPTVSSPCEDEIILKKA